MSYPSALDYKAAILAPERFLLDPVLRHTKPVMRKDSIAEPYQISGGFARVYKFKDLTGKQYAFRCWSADIGNTAIIYQGINEYLNQLHSDYFIGFHFRTQAILVNGTNYPGMRMDWVEAPSLQKFAYNNLSNPSILEACAEEFLNLARYLHGKHIAHGDLQGDNIKVLSEGGRLRVLLIDYDTMYVPNLSARPAVSSGLASYQHPRRIQSTQVTEKDDYFSELVIYLGLIGLARCPSVSKRFGLVPPDKDFIFSAQDIQSPLQSTVFHQLDMEGDGMVRMLANSLKQACGVTRIDQLKPLEEILKEKVLEPSIFQARTKVSLKQEDEKWLNPDKDDSVFVELPPQKPPVKSTPTSIPSPSSSQNTLARNPLDKNDKRAVFFLVLFAILLLVYLLVYIIAANQPSPPPQPQPQTQSSTTQVLTPGPVDTGWNLRINTATNVCSVQAATNQVQHGELLTYQASRLAACRDADSYLTFDPNDTAYCHDFTATTRRMCVAQGVTLLDKNGN